MSKYVVVVPLGMGDTQVEAVEAHHYSMELAPERGVVLHFASDSMSSERVASFAQWISVIKVSE